MGRLRAIKQADFGVWTNDHVISFSFLAYNLSRKNELDTSRIKKRVQADAHMMKKY